MRFVVVMLLGLIGLGMLLPGCAPTPPEIVSVRGTVTLNGKPLPGAEVQFVPMIQGFGGEYIATALTDDQGRYELKVLGKSGACACENRVTVSEGPLPEDARGQSAASQMRATRFLAALKNRPIPDKYTNLAQSPLKVEVKLGQSEYPLELMR
ncbi:DUF4198 domain-containing protein [Tuwongella immobilis]|uniref:Carboxypeptidase regulatory-like domain-containing protein n=1 Tax=Tuwongella immobilis TaxID=692036 RepID=A0A6C2YWC7_9BACT|nr:DUF4198 domain-containing protein [Tuwongella immobilis]VIP05764.1 Uncharacterized protein OS=Blastopirellula marina DSM 3645 GN=DSM3645_24635 PE=4 SV=1 [Tuwongella immobilis]VTS08884.1 Uncharacterized protein OS=Blastopirellula marina DSM 3645 GN=DSM3645_24635 PE=4 SV=1 [Tuwongella immobilis]